MTNEDIKAIEDLKNFKSIKILYGNTFVMYTEQLIKYQEASEIILNLIEKQQKELEIANNMRFKALKRVSELETENAQLRTELNSKDKLINCLIKELQEYLYDNKVTKEQIIENVLKECGRI